MKVYDLNQGIVDLEECIKAGRKTKEEIKGLQLAIDILEENRQEFEESQDPNNGPEGNQIYEAVSND